MNGWLADTLGKLRATGPAAFHAMLPAGGVVVHAYCHVTEAEVTSHQKHWETFPT